MDVLPGLAPLQANVKTGLVAGGFSKLRQVDTFHMEKDRNPFLRRAGRVVDSLSTSASSSVKWNL